MMGAQEHIDLFDRYRNGDLSDLEMREFDARLAYDAEFKEAFEHYEILESGIKAHFRNELKTKLQAFDQQMDRHSQRKAPSNRIFVWSVSIAASLFIGVFLFYHFSTNTNIQLAQEYWPVEPGLPVKMGTKGKYDDAMNAYKLGEFEEAHSLLENIPSDTSAYFSGVIAFEQNKFAEAKAQFKRIERTSSYYTAAQFRMGLIFLSEGDVNAAKKIFRAQIKENTSFKGTSEDVLKKIKLLMHR